MSQGPIIAQTPPTTSVRKAVEIYLAHAYPADGSPSAPAASPPIAVRKRLEILASLSDPDFYAAPAFERDAHDPPTRYALRLGNPFYPHMKLMLERSPDGNDFLLRVDTHDRHICPPPTSKEYAAFCQLMDRNQKLAQAIESDWAEHELPTFKTYLRQDLARRQAAKAGNRPDDAPRPTPA